MILEVTAKDKKNQYKRFKKYKDINNIKLTSNTKNDLELAFIKSFNQKNIKKRYSYIYDYMCKYLEENINVLCDFKDNKCIANRLNKSANKTNGCCYFNKLLCENLCSKKCNNPNISCKLFMCDYIENKIMKFKSIPKNYLLLDYFFNKKQKELIQKSYKMQKKDLIEELLLFK